MLGFIVEWQATFRMGIFSAHFDFSQSILTTLEAAPSTEGGRSKRRRPLYVRAIVRDLPSYDYEFIAVYGKELRCGAAESITPLAAARCRCALALGCYQQRATRHLAARARRRR